MSHATVEWIVEGQSRGSYAGAMKFAGLAQRPPMARGDPFHAGILSTTGQMEWLRRCLWISPILGSVDAEGVSIA